MFESMCFGTIDTRWFDIWPQNRRPGPPWSARARQRRHCSNAKSVTATHACLHTTRVWSCNRTFRQGGPRAGVRPCHQACSSNSSPHRQSFAACRSAAGSLSVLERWLTKSENRVRRKLLAGTRRSSPCAWLTQLLGCIHPGSAWETCLVKIGW